MTVRLYCLRGEILLSFCMTSMLSLLPLLFGTDWLLSALFGLCVDQKTNFDFINLLWRIKFIWTEVEKWQDGESNRTWQKNKTANVKVKPNRETGQPWESRQVGVVSHYRRPLGGEQGADLDLALFISKCPSMIECSPPHLTKTNKQTNRRVKTQIIQCFILCLPIHSKIFNSIFLMYILVTYTNFPLGLWTINLTIEVIISLLYKISLTVSQAVKSYPFFKDTDKLYFLIVPVSFLAAVRVLKCTIGLMRCDGNSHCLHSHRENN